MAEIVHRFQYAVEPQKLYEALTEQPHLARWWTPSCSVTARIGSEATFEFLPQGDRVKFIVESLLQGCVVQWRCLEAAGERGDWRGTTLRFEILPAPDGSELVLRHTGWAEDAATLESCSREWREYAGGLLKDYVEAPAGQPSPVGQEEPA